MSILRPFAQNAFGSLCREYGMRILFVDQQRSSFCKFVVEAGESDRDWVSRKQEVSGPLAGIFQAAAEKMSSSAVIDLVLREK